ncbi:MAG: hypothetical protein K6U74_05130 [Firmicutes bacterium]|nr:hypothetical protein [Bacillota bacterium]
MAVVSDTTVLIALGRIGLLWLLERLWGSVIIPEAVYQEALKGLHGSREITEAATKEGILMKQEAIDAVESLIKTNFRLSEAVIKKAVELIQKD